MLGHRSACGRGDDRGGGRDVEGASPVAAGADHVDDVVPPRVHGEDVLAHRLGAAGDLLRRLALRAQGDQEAADLRWRRLAAHDLAHRRACLRPAQRAALDQLGDALLDHGAPTRKLRAICGPSGVSTLSGWNWTPSTGSVRWRTPITSPSSVLAVTSSSAGTLVAASEW